MPWRVEQMRELATRFDERVRRDVSRFDRLIEPAHACGSVLRKPAAEPDVVRAEERLGVRLPPSYRSFLLVGDGAYASHLGAEIEDHWRHGLLAVSEVQSSLDVEAHAVEMWCERLPDLNDPANDDPPAPGNPKMVGFYAPYRDGLLLTHIHNGTNRLVLVPRPGVEEWELWIFAWEGATAFASFADFLEWYLAKPDDRPRLERADAYAQGFRDGQWFSLDDLAEVDPPRAVQLACDVLQAGSVDTHIPARLARFGDPRAIPTLRSTYADSDMWTMRAAVLSALQRLGADDAEALLRQAAEDPNAELRDWARRELSQGEQ